MKTNSIVMLFTALFIGVMSGVFFTWSNAVKPGIGKLTDIRYLESLQAMNKAILNPIFYGVFLAAVILIPVAIFINYNSQPTYIIKLLVVAFSIYLIGVFIVTLLGNIPLNNILENTNLTTITNLEAQKLRKLIEKKWNIYNHIRSFSSLITFIILLITIIKVSK